MLFPQLKKPAEKEYRCDRAGSLIFGESVPDGCFSDALNLSGDKFPLMSPRGKRADYTASAPVASGGEQITAVTDTPSGILVCTQSQVYLDGTPLEGAELDKNAKSRQAILTGRNVFIAPDGVFIKCTDSGVTVSRCNFSESLPRAELSYCTEDGTDIYPDFQGDFPDSAQNGDTLITESQGRMVHLTFNGEKWENSFDIFIHLHFSSPVTGISEGEVISVKSKGESLSDGSYTVRTVLPESLVLEGILVASGEIVNVTIKRNMPLIDFAVEHNNRIWACRYGKNRDGKFVNEIYASKQGDPTQWFSFQGISTDSYTVSLGCPGEFTGAGTAGNQVVFFKENYLIRVIGSEPSDFTVYTVSERGVEKGQEKSLVNMGERLFYKSPDGIAVYDGGSVSVISERGAFKGFSDAAAGVTGGKYVIALSSPEKERFIYTFDTENGLWHKENDELHTLLMFNKDGGLFHVCREGNTVFSRDGEMLSEDNSFLPFFGEIPLTPSSEKDVEWYGETGQLCRYITCYNKRVRALRLSLTLPEGSVFRAFIKPDSAEHFREIFFLDKKTEGIFSCTVPVPQCRYFTLRFQGTGDFTLHGYSAIISYTGEVTAID